MEFSESHSETGCDFDCVYAEEPGARVNAKLLKVLIFYLLIM